MAELVPTSGAVDFCGFVEVSRDLGEAREKDDHIVAGAGPDAQQPEQGGEGAVEKEEREKPGEGIFRHLFAHAHAEVITAADAEHHAHEQADAFGAEASSPAR